MIKMWWLSHLSQWLKHLPAVRETGVQSLSLEDPLEKEMATRSSTLAWRIPWREEPGRLQSMGLQIAGHDWATSFCFFLSFFPFLCLLFFLTPTEHTHSPWLVLWSILLSSKIYLIVMLIFHHFSEMEKGFAFFF